MPGGEAMSLYTKALLLHHTQHTAFISMGSKLSQEITLLLLRDTPPLNTMRRLPQLHFFYTCFYPLPRRFVTWVSYLLWEGLCFPQTKQTLPHPPLSVPSPHLHYFVAIFRKAFWNDLVCWLCMSPLSECMYITHQTSVFTPILCL